LKQSKKEPENFFEPDNHSFGPRERHPPLNPLGEKTSRERKVMIAEATLPAEQAHSREALSNRGMKERYGLERTRQDEAGRE